MSEITIHEAFHKLWTKAVGTDGYDKKEWIDLERHIMRLDRLERTAFGTALSKEINE